MPYVIDPATGQRILCTGTQQEALAMQRTLDKRQQIAQEWCAARGITIDDLSDEQVLEIRKLPEWQNAGVEITLSKSPAGLTASVERYRGKA